MNCSHEGCARPPKTRGFCQSHYVYALRHGLPLLDRSPSRCRVEDCQRDATGKGLCPKHYTWWKAGGEVAGMESTIPDNYRQLVRIGWVETDSGCWEFSGKRESTGYGKVGGALAHRTVWAYHNHAIPKGAVIRHSCDNPPCVNPDHLLIGTYSDNAYDKVARGRDHFSNLTHCRKGHPLSGDNLVPSTLKRGSRDCLTCNRASNSETYRLVRQARQALGLTHAQYLAIHGGGKINAKRVLQEFASQ